MVAVCIAIFGKQRLNSPKRLCRSCGWNVTILPRIEIYAFGYFKLSVRRVHIQLASAYPLKDVFAVTAPSLSDRTAMGRPIAASPSILLR